MKEPWRELLRALLNRGTLREIEFTGDHYPRPELYGFLTQDQPAKDGICFHCGDGGLKIVWTKHDDKPVLYVVCHECGSHKISESQLRQWKIIMPVFFEKLAATFGINHSVKSVVPEMVWLLGQKDGIEYYFVRYVNILKPTQVTVELLKSPKSVVLTTNETFTEILQQFLPQPCLALETVVTLNQDGTMTADISEQLKVAFPEPSAPPFEFRKKGQGWILRFEGKETFLKDGVGPHYLSLLLKKPFKQVFAVALHAMVAGQTPDKEARVGMAESIVDEQTQKEIEDRLRELAVDIAEAQKSGDHLVEQESQEEYNELLAFYQKNIGLAGQVRKEHDASAKIRQAVLKAIQRTIILIEDELPECATHLEDSIVTGSKFNYIPVKVVPWVL